MSNAKSSSTKLPTSFTKLPTSFTKLSVPQVVAGEKADEKEVVLGATIFTLYESAAKPELNPCATPLTIVEGEMRERKIIFDMFQEPDFSGDKFGVNRHYYNWYQNKYVLKDGEVPAPIRSLVIAISFYLNDPKASDIPNVEKIVSRVKNHDIKDTWDRMIPSYAAVFPKFKCSLENMRARAIKTAQAASVVESVLLTAAVSLQSHIDKSNR
jgi:hypothetical protein